MSQVKGHYDWGKTLTFRFLGRKPGHTKPMISTQHSTCLVNSPQGPVELLTRVIQLQVGEAQPLPQLATQGYEKEGQGEEEEAGKALHPRLCSPSRSQIKEKTRTISGDSKQALM